MVAAAATSRDGAANISKYEQGITRARAGPETGAGPQKREERERKPDVLSLAETIGNPGKFGLI